MIKVRQIKVPVLKDSDDFLIQSIVKKLHIQEKELLNFVITKQSIDARDKENVLFIYEVNAKVINEEKVLKYQNKDVSKVREEVYQIPKTGTEKLESSIVIVGSGPAGLFAAYILVEAGFKPIIIERGEKIEQRVATVKRFWQVGELKQNSNVQFGEGGAGTFSDGKLNTLVNDKFFRNKKVLETFVKFGAPEEILYLQKPHIGTDILRRVIVNMRRSIIKMGGTFYYESCLTNILVQNNALQSIEINHEKRIPCKHLIVAIGHSARDTFKMLYDKGVNIESKPFAVGVRIEHPQEWINKNQYGEFSKYLTPASYKLTYTTNEGRGVYSFCMCPGGYVVNASSEKNRLAINGMSNHARDSKNANSALVVSVSPKDFGENPLDGLEFQKRLEEKAFLLGKGSIPIQLYKDYIHNRKSKEFGSFKTEMQGAYTFANLNDLFPSFINESLKEAIFHFGKKIKHFDDDDVLLSGVESRTSSPVRIVRDEQMEANIKGIYPCGEGAGYAGGITTAAMDGIKVAESMITKYSNII